MKNKIKLVLLVVLLMIITSSISVYATQLYMAKDISYTKFDGTKTNVETALDELYSNVVTGVIEYQTIASSGYKTTSSASVFDTQKVTIPKGKKKVYIYSSMNSTWGNQKPDIISDIIVSEETTLIKDMYISGVISNHTYLSVLETTGDTGDITINYSSAGNGKHFVQALVFYK